MKICILHIGHSEPGTTSAHLPSPVRFKNALKPHLQNATWTTISAVTDKLPAPEAYDAYLITGGKYSVFEKLDWQDDLFAFIRELDRLRRPLLAICYGHQAVAHALGGHVERSDKGWGVGLMSTTATHNTGWGPGEGESFMLHAMHQDQVTTPPNNAEIWLESEFCPISGFTLGNHFLCIQQHPDFTPELNRDLILKRRDRIGETRSLTAIEALNGVDHTDESAKWLAGFLLQADA